MSNQGSFYEWDDPLYDASEEYRIIFRMQLVEKCHDQLVKYIQEGDHDGYLNALQALEEYDKENRWNPGTLTFS